MNFTKLTQKIMKIDLTSYLVGFGVVPFFGSSGYLSYRYGKYKTHYNSVCTPSCWPTGKNPLNSHSRIAGESMMFTCWSLAAPISIPYYLVTTVAEKTGEISKSIKIEIKKNDY